MQDNILLLLMLVAAIAVGWWLGIRQNKLNQNTSFVDEKYYRGLNFLLNHQTDAALDLFIDALKVNNQNLETHLALGNAFRRKGEVDKAIHIHQNILNQQGLTHSQLAHAQLELSHDFVKAGLLDRAEKLLMESSRFSSDKSAWGTLLLDIYQREQDWQKALDVGNRFKLHQIPSLAERLSHYACERAQEYLNDEQFGLAEKLLKQAAVFKTNNSRVDIFRASMTANAGNYIDAIKLYKNVAQEDVELIPIILPDLCRCYIELNDQEGWQRWLDEIIEKHPSTSVILARAEIMRNESDELAADFVTEQLHIRPSVKGFSYLIGLHKDWVSENSKNSLTMLRELADVLEESKQMYQCRHCGYASNTLDWQCPTCNHWNTTKPVFGLRGE